MNFMKYLDKVINESKETVTETEFGSVASKMTRKELLKYIPADALKGINTHNTKVGARNNWEVFIPKNKHFPEGIYHHVGDAEDSTDAKMEFLRQLLNHYEEDRLEFIKTGTL